LQVFCNGNRSEIEDLGKGYLLHVPGKVSVEEDHIMLDIYATEDLCNQGIAATDDSPKYSYSAGDSPK
jgi:hypothetical protein